MFVFKPTSNTYSDPVAATFPPGIPFGREYSRGDICLLHDGFSSSKTFLNSKILREAMLNSKEYLEDILGIKITDVKTKVESSKIAEDYESPEVYEPVKSEEPEVYTPDKSGEPEVIDVVKTTKKK